jgi:hypothetical protein
MIAGATRTPSDHSPGRLCPTLTNGRSGPAGDLVLRMPELEDEPRDPLIAAIAERFGLEVGAARRMDGGGGAAVWWLRTIA